MIYTLTWNIDENVHSVSGNYDSLWYIYLAIKNQCKNIKPQRDINIWCLDPFGRYIDLKGGIIPRFATDDKKRILLCKGNLFK
jgi:hypothetical protein